MQIDFWKLIRSICLVAILIAITACASPTHAGYLKKMNSWVGLSENELPSRLGSPESVHLLASGDKILIYEKTSFAEIGGYVTPASTLFRGSTTNGLEVDSMLPSQTHNQSSPGVLVVWSCSTMFTVRSGHIHSVEWAGNFCTSADE